MDIDRTLDQNDVIDIVEKLICVQTDAEKLGGVLKLQQYQVNAIIQQYSRPTDRLYYIIGAFVNQVNPRPAWRFILQALRSPLISGGAALAQKIEEEHFSRQPMQGQPQYSGIQGLPQYLGQPMQGQSQYLGQPMQGQLHYTGKPVQDQPQYPGKQMQAQSHYPGQQMQGRSHYPGQPVQGWSHYSGQPMQGPSHYPGQPMQGPSHYPGQPVQGRSHYSGQPIQGWSHYPGQPMQGQSEYLGQSMQWQFLNHYQPVHGQPRGIRFTAYPTPPHQYYEPVQQVNPIAPTATCQYTNCIDHEELGKRVMDLKSKFRFIVISANSYLKKNITKKKLELLKIDLSSLPMMGKTHYLFVKKKRKRIRKAKSVQKVFDIIEPHWNYVDYTLLEHIVDHYCDKKI